MPLLIENNLNEKGDILIFIKSKKSKILERLSKRENYDKNILKILKENQTVLLKKKKLANYIIYNNYSLKIMEKKIKYLKHKIINETNYT